MTAESKDTPSELEVKLKEGATLRTPNTISNRKVVAVMLRQLKDEQGKPLYTFEEISALLGYPDRRNTHNFWREFSQAGEDFQDFCERRRKIDGPVKAYIEEIWRQEPLMPVTVVCQRVKGHFGLSKLSDAPFGKQLPRWTITPFAALCADNWKGESSTIEKSGF